MVIEEIELIYDPKTGVTSIHVTGVKGRTCTKLTEELEKNLGGKVRRNITSEYSESTTKAGSKLGGA